MIFGFFAFFGGFGYWSTRQAAQLLKAQEQYSTIGTSQSDEFKAAGIEE
jgi:predicted negative regulator of RcsB-dependent stress response